MICFSHHTGTPEQRKIIVALAETDKTMAEIADITGVSKSSVSNIISQDMLCDRRLERIRRMEL